MRFTILFLMVFCSILAFADDGNDPKVLLVPDSLQNYAQLSKAVAPGVITIKFSTRETTLENLIARIETNLKGRKASSIGFAVHDYGEAKFYLTAQETISLSSTLVSKQQQGFWKAIGNMVTKKGRVDLFACNLAKTDQGKMLVSSIAESSGREVAASIDETGNPKLGGDWILETAQINIADIYFTPSKLNKFSSLLYSQRKKLLPSDPGSSDKFGGSIAIYQDYAIAGSHYDDVNIAGDGSAYIFFRNQGGENNWGQLKKLYDTSNTTDVDAFYGYSVSINESYAVVGARQSDKWAENSGTAFVYEKHHGGTNNWGLVREIKSNDIESWDFFGESVHVSGTTIVIGAPWEDNGSERWGAAYVFEKDHGGTDNWGQVTKLTAPDRSQQDEFGESVSNSGEWVIVGAPKDNLPGDIWDAGSVYIFNKNYPSPGGWGLSTKITDPAGAEDDEFGSAVDIDSSGWAIVGAPHDNSNRGSAHLLGPNPTTGFEYRKNLGAPTYNSSDVGQSVSITSDYAIVGAPGFHTGGRAFVFYRNQGSTNNWGLYKTLTASDPTDGDQFGFSVAISGKYAIAGANEDHAPEYASGSAYLFEVGNTVTVSSATGGNTDKAGDNIVFDGDSFTVKASPITGYAFTQWTGNASGSSNPLTISNIYNDLTINPVFTRTYGTLNINISAGTSGGSYTITGPPDFNSGNPISNRTTNYSSVVPTGTYSVVFTNPVSHNFSQTASSFTVNTYTTSGSLEASATETISGTYTIKQYGVTVTSVPNGSTNRDGVTTIDYGGSVNIAATPATNYFLSAWTGDATGISNPLNITNITSDLSITPEFTRFTGTLNVDLSPDASGASYSISGPPDFNGGNPLTGQTANFSQVVPTGDYAVTFLEPISHNFNANATSFTVSGYTVSGALTNAATETVSGTYNIKQYSITVGAAALGHTDHDGVTTVNHGDSLSITAIPDFGFSLQCWSGDFHSTDNPVTISNITQGYSLTPIFSNRKGSLRVNLTGTDDGRWRIVGQSRWLRSGEVQPELHFGDVTVECLPIPGFRKPHNKTVRIREEGIREVTLDYNIFTDPPIMHYFTATPEEVAKGGKVTLAWEAEGSSKVIITPHLGEIGKDIGSTQVVVDKTTTFTMKAKNSDRTSAAATTVTIAPKLEILKFAADRKLVHKGDNLTITWLTGGAEKIALLDKTTKAKTELESQGSLVVTPEITTNYQLTATDAGGKSTSGKLKVKVTEDPVVNYFRTSTDSACPGKPATLSWEVAGADSVDIQPGIGQAEAIGEMVVTPMETTTYTLTARGNGTDKLASTKITAVSKAPDLKLSFVGITSNGEEVKKPAVGEQTAISLTLENLGNVTARNVKVALESEGGSCCCQVISKIAPGEKLQISFDWCAHQRGKHVLNLAADPANAIGELDETNNLVTRSIRTAAVDGIDLLADNINVELADDGKTARVRFTILNAGNKASGSFQYQVFLTKNGKQKLTKALALVADDHIDSLAPGEKVTLTRTVKLNKATKKLYLQGLVDIHEAIVEVNKENNHVVRRVK